MQFICMYLEVAYFQSLPQGRNTLAMRMAAQFLPRDANARARVSTPLHCARTRRARCITFPARIPYPVAFLTLCARVDYTYKFDTCRLGGLTVALCLQGEPAAFR
jgi:hypothetical protein